MKKRTLVASSLPLALAACIGPFARTAPYAYDKKGDLVEFSYAWSAEVTANRPLARRLRGDLERAFTLTQAAALADRAAASAAGRPFHGHQYSRRWTTAGNALRLLSLDGRLTTFTGGAHPDYRADSLLWDRTARTEVHPADLFASSGDLERLVGQPGCAILNSERAKRRGGVLDGVQADCPPLGKVAIIPSDADHNRRLDHIRIVAANGVAGPYVEGTYDISVPVTASVLAAIKPAWRPSFEVAQPQ